MISISNKAQPYFFLKGGYFIPKMFAKQTVYVIISYAPIGTVTFLRRTQAMGESGHWSAIAHPSERSGVGAKNHCVHGKGISEETIQDWRPFEYGTSMNIDANMKYQNIYLFTPLDDGERTRVEIRLKLYKPSPLWLSRIMVKMEFAREKPYQHWFESIKQLMETNSVEPLRHGDTENRKTP